MGTITSSLIMSEARLILNDAAGVRWSEAEFLLWINAGIAELAMIKPTSFIRKEAVDLIPGTAQRLPDDALCLIDIPYNVNPVTRLPGKVIRLASRALLDTQSPMWRQANPAVEVTHYCVNALTPKLFECYPPQPVNKQGCVMLIYGALPPALSDGATPLPVDDVYHGALLDYTLYRASLKDMEGNLEAAQAAAYLSAFRSALEGKAKIEVTMNPNNTAPGAINTNQRVN